MIQVVEKGKIPVYEVKCDECGSKIRYTRSDVTGASITCPECSCRIVCSMSTQKVDEISSPDYICEDVGSALKDLEKRFEELEKSRYEPPLDTSLHYSNDSYIMAVKDCKAILEEVKKDWTAK